MFERVVATYGGDVGERHTRYVGLSAVDVMEQVLVQARVLRVIRCDLLSTLQVDADLQPDGSRHRRTIGPLL